MASKTVNLARHLASSIRSGGPIPVANYMREVLTHSSAGYYMTKDVFGEKGDFITSPEISQMFGEMIGVWIVNEWMHSNEKLPFQIVELGPGRGTLAADILRVTEKFPRLKKELSVHMVEVSPLLRYIQQEVLKGNPLPRSFPDSPERIDQCEQIDEITSKCGVPVRWHLDLASVPRQPGCILAHEFMDALPIHKFQMLVKSSLVERDHVEVCPEAGVVVQEMAGRVAECGGSSLLIDYGHSGEKQDTFRAFKSHKLHDPLEDPGSADLTADVDFAFLNKMVSEKYGDEVDVHGPIPQGAFLVHMGIMLRLEVLLRNCPSAETRRTLVSGFERLVSPNDMGERFKVMALLPGQKKAGQDYVPAGFKPPELGPPTSV